MDYVENDMNEKDDKRESRVLGFNCDAIIDQVLNNSNSESFDITPIIDSQMTP